MPKPRNPLTPVIRKIVSDWLSINNKPFTVSDICEDINLNSSDYLTIDLTKYVSNELIRREKVGVLVSEKGSPERSVNGNGRPPRVYTKIYCAHTLSVLRGL